MALDQIDEYLVEEGENLFDITKKFYVDPTLYAELGRLNGIGDSDRLEAGQRIKLPMRLYRKVKLTSDIEMQCTVEVAVSNRICDCDKPKENYPYRDGTFEMISYIKDLVLKASEDHRVSAIAVAGAIADEYNTREGFKAFVDDLQDNMWIHWFSEKDFRNDAIYGIDSKILNSTKNDLGIGNIKLETAKMIYDKFPETFKSKGWGYEDLVKYIQTNGGTCHLAALYIKYGWELLGSLICDYPSRRMEAVLVTFYKQGERKFFENREKSIEKYGPDVRIRPGEGCRVCLQREKIMKALGLKEIPGFPLADVSKQEPI